MKLIFILSCVLIICAISVHSEELEASVGETNKFEEAPENDEEVDINWFELQHETIEQQADQPTSGEQFIAIRIGAAGNKDQVNPNLEGLVRIATQFLPNTYTFINVESASREVVAGIKYELLINALDENKSEVLCEIRILERPWIITSENEKLRTLMYSNCSTDGPYSNEPRGNDVQHSINPIFNNEEKVMTEARLKDMESLIIIPTVNKTPKPPQAALPERLEEASVPQPKEDEDGLTVVTLSRRTSSFLDDFFSVGKTENKPVQGSVIENEVIPKLEAPAIIEATPNRGDSENTFYQVAPNQDVEAPVTPTPETSSQAPAIQVTNNEIPLNREVLQVTCAKIQTVEETSEIKPVPDTPLETRDGNIEGSNLNVERQKRATDGIDPMVPEKRLLKKLLNAALTRLDRYDEDDNKRIFLSILASSVRGKLFTMDVRVADTKCSESTISAKYCKSQIIDESIKVCRFEIENLDNGDIKLKKSECVPDNRKKRQIPGGARPANEAEHQLVLEFLNEALATGDKQGYSLERVIEATVQTVAGKLYKVKAEFTADGSTKVCNVEIWDRPWLGKAAREVKFECDTPARRKRQTLGGVSPISHSEVQPILNEVLSEGDYQSYRLVRIIEATSQVVEGISYAIKAEFTVEGESRICSLTIWDRPWLGKSARVVEFKECDGESVARAKRQAPPPGSPRSVNQDEYPKIEEMLTTALASGDRQNFRLARILHVTKQLSSGWTYKIRGAFEVDGVIKRCNIKLWNRPWLSNAATVESFKCDEHDEQTIRSNHDEKIKRTLDLYLHGNFSDNKIFEIYERLYNKNYPTALNRNMRLRIFKTNLRKIRDLNQNERGTATYGITEFADLTSTEYRMRTGLLRKTSHTNHISNPIAEIPNIALPREFDWRTRGAVSEVKNQGSCGSCWAFSVIGNIEGIHAIKTGVLEEYSEQELVDCDTLDQGCNGGLPDDAYKAIEQLGGLETEKDYPYTARRGHCSFNSTKVKTQIKGAVDLPKNETAIAQWLLQNGPVSIGINANAMQFYRGGVSHPWHVLCNKSDLDHGVLIVGFGVHEYPKFNKTLPFWTIKNSWGPRWGEQGYYRVYRGDNTCGVSEMVSSAVLE